MINEKFLIKLQGKSYVTYEGLLDLAHQSGLKSIEVEILQIPSEENNMMAICKSIIKTEDKTFVDIGDASPKSVNSALVPHIIRMASTRAKARALRDLTNIGMTAIEELSIDDNVVESEAIYKVDPPTQRQIDTLKKLLVDSNMNIDLDTLDKKSAGTLISRLIDERKNKSK